MAIYAIRMERRPIGKFYYKKKRLEQITQAFLIYAFILLEIAIKKDKYIK